MAPLTVVEHHGLAPRVTLAFASERLPLVGNVGLITSKLLLAALARRTSAFRARRTLTLNEERLNRSKMTMCDIGAR
jgi:hypothetical protein